MAFSITSFWNYGREYCSIEHATTPTGETRISGITAILTKGEYDIDRRFQTEAISSLSEHLKKDQHCYLLINNDQVILKSTTVKGSDIKIVASAFPNIDQSEFYYQIQKLPQMTWVALIRKKHVKDILRSYASQKICVIGFSLSFMSICPIAYLLEKDIVFISGFRLLKNSNEVMAVQKAKENTQETYTIGDTQISNTFLLALSGLFHYDKISDVGVNTVELNTKLRTVHLQKTFFRKGLVIGVLVLLLALAVNFYYFTSFHSSLQTLLAQHNVELAQQDAYKEQAQLLAEKEKIAKNIYANSISKSTFYLNRIIALKPETVILSEFNFQPVRKQMKKEEEIDLEKYIIVLRGESREGKNFSDWIKQLEDSRWIQNVTVSDYGQTEKNKSDFIISIKFNPNEAIP